MGGKGGQVLQLLPDDSRLGVRQPEVGDFAPSKEENGILRGRNEDDRTVIFQSVANRSNGINS